MAVPTTESAKNVESQSVEDPPTSRFTWIIEKFSARTTKNRLRSDTFVFGGYKWRILLFPNGNKLKDVSMFLELVDMATLPNGGSQYAHFNLTILNQRHRKDSITEETEHEFKRGGIDRGIAFMPLGDLCDPTRGYIVNDTVIVEVVVGVRRIVDYWSYDSKKETNYVGLKNQGATCYMNSLLQTLFHLPYFRKAVYHMPTTRNDMPTASIPLALQSLFYKLQYSDSNVSTKELTKSFGWDTFESFKRHDAHELNRVLCAKLEEKMKGTMVDGAIRNLFEGYHANYIQCIDVDYKYTRIESFYDLQLDVKGCPDVYASFDKYIKVERLEDDNKYHAEQHGLQDARKGVLFVDFSSSSSAAA